MEVKRELPTHLVNRGAWEYLPGPIASRRKKLWQVSGRGIGFLPEDEITQLTQKLLLPSSLYTLYHGASLVTDKADGPHSQDLLHLSQN